MTTGHIGVKEAATPDKYIASHSITEDTKTKEIQRLNLNDPTGADLSARIGAGDVAHDAADSGNPLKIGGKALSANPAAVASGDRANALMDLIGRIVVAVNTLQENISTAITSSMTGTTSTLLLAAPGAGLRWYIDAYAVANSDATGTSVNLQDGNGGTAFWSIPAAKDFGGANVSLPVPIPQPTTNTALYCVNTVTGAAVIVSIVAHKGV